MVPVNPLSSLLSNMATFNFQPLSRFEGKDTTIKRPKHILQFSYDGNRDYYVGSDQALRYYYPPFFPAPGRDEPLYPINLSGGIESWIKQDQESAEHLVALLATIEEREKALMDCWKDELRGDLDADFVCYRGMMTKILTALFDDRSDFEMNATCYQDTIYIEENHAYALQSEAKQNKEQNSQRWTGKQAPETYSYWGYKFESISTIPRQWSECTREECELDTRDDDIVNNNIQYCSIVRTGIGNSSILIGGEIDCIDGEKTEFPAVDLPWVELKTARDPGDNQRAQENFERKLCRMWAQSFLIGCPTIVVGMRDDYGNLTRIKEFQTEKIPNQVLRNFGMWNGDVCINFASKFLDFLKQTIKGTEGVWRIKRPKNGKMIIVTQVEAKGTGDIIPERFKMHRETLHAVQYARSVSSTPPSVYDADEMEH